MKLAEKLELMRLINFGCKLHPKYKADRQPRCACHDCNQMWQARVKLRLAAAGKL